MAPQKPDEYTVGDDGNPFPNLIQFNYFKKNPTHAPSDFAVYCEKLLAQLKRTPDTDTQLTLIADNLPGLPLVGDCLANDALRKQMRDLNKKILSRAPHDQHGIKAGVAWQSLWDYDNAFEYLLAQSPVLTMDDVRKAQSIPVFGSAKAYIFEMLKTTSKGDETEVHYLVVTVDSDGEKRFVEGVWNLHDIPTAKKDVVASLYGKFETCKRMPNPATPFGRAHAAEPTIGPQDMTLGGVYKTERDTYALRSEKVFGWDRQAKGRPFWRARNVLEFRISEQQHRNFAGLSSLVETSTKRGSVLSAGIHYANNSCLNMAVQSLFSGGGNLENENLPSHRLMFKLGELADKIYLSKSENASVDEFLGQYVDGYDGSFARSNPADYKANVNATLKRKTLRASHDGQPPFVVTYLANHLGKEEIPALKDLLHLSNQIHLAALEKMADAA